LLPTAFNIFTQSSGNYRTNRPSRVFYISLTSATFAAISLVSEISFLYLY